MRSEFTFDVIKVLAEKKYRNETVRLTVTSWSGLDPKIDIRRWYCPEGETELHAGKGVALSMEDARTFCDALSKYLTEQDRSRLR